jgi:hypothetical protein
MRKLAEHHPARRQSLGRCLRGCTRSGGRRSAHGTPGVLQRQTYVQEFWLTGADGYAIMPANFRSEAATNAIWDRHSKRGAYRRDHYVEGKARPLRKHTIKRYK